MARKLVTLAVLGAAALGLAATDTARRRPHMRDGVYERAGGRVRACSGRSARTVTRSYSSRRPARVLGGRRRKPLWETFEFISSEMPEDDPGSLRPEEYAAVLAYIFSVYGLPSGDAELAVDQESLEAIPIVRPALPGS
jgi:hypothetical protein